MRQIQNRFREKNWSLCLPRDFPHCGKTFAVAPCRSTPLSRWAAAVPATSFWMAVLSQGVGVPAIAVQSHTHGHQHRQQGSHCHPGGGGEGVGHHRPRLVIEGGAVELGGPGVLHHNHSVDGFW